MWFLESVYVAEETHVCAIITVRCGPGQQSYRVEFCSTDTTDDETQNSVHSKDTIRKHSDPRTPPHALKLKVGALSS